jgi:hypothetical protein
VGMLLALAEDAIKRDVEQNAARIVANDAFLMRLSSGHSAAGREELCIWKAKSPAKRARRMG